MAFVFTAVPMNVFTVAFPVVITPAFPPNEIFRFALLKPVLATAFVVWLIPAALLFAIVVDCELDVEELVFVLSPVFTTSVAGPPLPCEGYVMRAVFLFAFVIMKTFRTASPVWITPASPPRAIFRLALFPPVFAEHAFMLIKSWFESSGAPHVWAIVARLSFVTTK